MKARVVWSPRSIRRGTEEALFITEENPSAAADWARGLFNLVRPLARFPEMGRVVPEVGRSEIREIMFSEYRVVYRVAPRFVEVLTVRHGKRRLPHQEVGASKPR